MTNRVVRKTLFQNDVLETTPSLIVESCDYFFEPCPFHPVEYILKRHVNITGIIKYYGFKQNSNSNNICGKISFSNIIKYEINTLPPGVLCARLM